MPNLSKSLTAALLLSAAAGTQAQVTAGFEVTSFSYTVSGGTLQWLGDSSFQSLAVEAAEAGGLLGNDADSASGSVAAAALSTAVAHAAAAVSVTGPGLLQGQTSATPFFVSSISNPHFATVLAQQAQEFMLSQPGSVTFTLNYSLAAAAPAGQPTYSYSQSALAFDAGNYANTSGGSQTVELFSDDFASGSGAQSGSWVFTVQIDNASEVGFYNLRGNAYASAISAVPEPASGLLLAGGAAVLLLRRGRGRAA
jgi:hypothetical protein